MWRTQKIWKVTLCILPVIIFAALIEFAKASQLTFPVPFLSLYAATTFAAGIGGLTAGFLAGLLSGSYVFFSHLVGFGPQTLTGALPQTIIGAAVYVITGYLLGRTKDERDRGLSEKTRSLVKRDKDLRDALDILRIAQEAGGIGTWVADVDAKQVSWDKTNIRLHGFSALHQKGTLADLVSVVHPDDVSHVTELYGAALNGTAEFDTEYRVMLPDGTIRHLKGNAVVVLNEANQPSRVIGTNYDLTRLRRNEAELLRTQRIANQAQKMEAVGQLTGGIAHDFNNLLAVIRGNLELLQDAETGNNGTNISENRDIIASALAAVELGGGLTRKMLAFARQSSLDPAPLDINSVVRETERWLSRTILSNIEIETKLQSKCWKAHLDQSSLQSAILNIVVNARDAMPEGGKLKIETSNVTVDRSNFDDLEEDLMPGRFVMLSITDTGEGISPANLKRIFDPFFTTKEVGVGTGLGLSMVQGFVKQSKGFVRVLSELGVGTSIRLFFPVSDEDKKKAGAANRASELQASTAGKSRLLIVDDEIQILKVLKRGLNSDRYLVETAVSGDHAHEVFLESGPFDLLVTDVVMPGRLQGPALAQELRALDPHLSVIFMSGYSRDASIPEDFERNDDTRLTKPVSRSELERAIDFALARRGNRVEAN